MFTKKKKREGLTGSLTVGLRTQLCKECQGFYARACEVDGKPCLFHRWVEEDTILISAESEPVFSRHTLALVEYPDGSVGKVKPELVTFLDKEV